MGYERGGGVTFEFPAVDFGFTTATGATVAECRKSLKAAEKREARARKARKAAKRQAEARAHETSVARAALLDIAQNGADEQARVDAADRLLVS